MRISLSDGRHLTYVSNVSDDLRPQAELLLGRLAATAPALEPDQELPVRLDWGIVKLIRRNDEMSVEEPDYRTDARRFVPRVTFTCAVLRAQQQLLERLNADPQPVHYDQAVLVYPGALAARRVVAIRRDPLQPVHTGWHVFDEDLIDWDLDAQAVGVYDVPRQQPALMSILALPTGWAVRFEQDTLLEAAPPGGTPMTLGMTFDLSG
jgi:hypothetical protein